MTSNAPSDGARDAFPDVDLACRARDAAGERRAAADPPYLGVPADVGAQVLRQQESRRHGVHGRAGGRRDTGQRIVKQQPRPGPYFDRMRTAAWQADGLHVLQRDEALQPAVPANGDRRPDDLRGPTGELKFPVGRVDDPDLSPRQRHGTGEPAAVLGEEQNGVGLVDDAEFGGRALVAGE